MTRILFLTAIAVASIAGAAPAYSQGAGSTGQARGGGAAGGRGGAGTMTVNGVPRDYTLDTNGDMLFIEPSALAVSTAPGGFSLRVTDYHLSRTMQKGDEPGSLDLSIDGPGLAPESFVRQAIVSRATDSLGLSVAGSHVLRVIGGSPSFGPSNLSGARQSRMYNIRGGGRAGEMPARSMIGAIELGPLPPTTTELRLVEGEIEIFSPSPALTATFELQPSTTGPLSSDLLRKYGLEVYPVARENWATARARFGELGQQENLPDGVNLAVFVRDPQSRLGGIAYKMPTSTVGPTSSGTAGITGGAPKHAGDTYLFPNSAPLPAGTKLVIYIAAPEALRRIPFRFENIGLGTPEPGAGSQPAQKPSGPAVTSITSGNISFAISGIVQNRSRLGGQMQVATRVTSAGANPVAALSPILTIARAIDNAGRSLVPLGRPAMGPGSMRRPINLSRPASIVAEFMPAPATATSIAVMEGEIEVYAPSVASGSVVLIKGADAQASGPIKDSALAAKGVDVTILTAKNWEKVGAPLGFERPDFAAGPAILVQDPSALVADVEFLTPSGTIIVPTGFNNRGNNRGTLWTLKYDAPLPADAQLGVYLRLPEAFKTVPFKFENVPL